MKKTQFAIIMIAAFCLTFMANAQNIPYTGNGRIVISSDGNEHDHDDWAATPFSLALLAAKNYQNKVTVYTYSDHIWGSNVDHSNAKNEMIISAETGGQKFGFNSTNFIEAVSNKNSAYNAIAAEINKSTASNPLYIIAAGPMQVVGEGISRANQAKLQYVRIISHSGWNDRHSDKPISWENHSGWTWDEIKNTFSSKGLTCDHIVDQNGGNGYDGMRAAKSKFNWLKTSPHKTPAWDWLYSRQEKVVKGGDFDPSDAGMIIYLLTGIEKTDPSDAKNIMESGSAPPATTHAIPGTVQAEEYSSMSGVQTENTSDNGGGQNVGFIDNGDWMDYKVNVANAGDYKVEFRVASKSATIKLNLKKGNATLGSISTASTGGWQNWKTVNTTVTLTKGVQTLRVQATGSGWNINWMKFTETGSNPPPTGDAPIGKTISLKGNNNSFVSSENGVKAMICNRPAVGAWEKFTVVDAGNGKVALKGNNGKYVTDGSPMWCNSNTISNAAKFTWTDAGGGLIALKGNNGNFVSSENGTKAMNCNRTAIGAWEKFTWAEVPKSTLAESNTNFSIFPNPAKDAIQLSLEEATQIEIFNMQGKLVYNAILEGNSTILTTNLGGSGMYLVKAGNTVQKLLVK